MKPPVKVRDLPASETARQWARLRFDPQLRPLAAWVADVIRGIAGVEWSAIEPIATFTRDLRMDDLEPVELVMALEQELGIRIPDEDCASIETVADLIGYLDKRLSSMRDACGSER